MTYPSLSVGEFGYRLQITFTGVGQRHFPVCSQKDKGLTLPWRKYFEVLTHHYAWSNKEFEEFQTSFASNKTSYYMANPVLGKSLCSDWFFLGQDFAVRFYGNGPIRVFLFWSEACKFKICNQNSEKKV